MRSENHRLADTAYEIPVSAWRVEDMPERLRPREETERVGVENVSDDVLLALLLRAGIKGLNVVDLSRGLITRYGNLSGLAAASVEELSQIRGVGPTKAQIIKAALELGARLNSEKQPKKQKVRTPQDVMRLLGDRAQALEHEVFWAILLDNKNFLKCRPVDVSVGLLNASLVHPREVFIEAIRTASAAIVLAHNHPSGDPSPSAEDIRVTKQLVESGKIVDIKVLDHVIIGRRDDGGSDRYVSLREEGLVEFR